MGLLDIIGSVAGHALNGNQQAGGNPLIQLVLSQLQNSQHGGLTGLVSQLQQGGLGDIVNSWVGTGQNLPVSGEQLHQALGQEGGLLQQLTQGSGLSTQDIAGQLSHLLPGLVDKLTPGGQVPASSDLGGLLAGLLGGGKGPSL